MTTETAAARTAETATAEPARYHSTDPSRDFTCSRWNIDVAGEALHTHATERNPGPNPAAVHPWERCGLGVAPYRLIGSGKMTYQATPDAPVQPGASCDYCSQGITNVYFIRAACGSTFHVGCDCVHKVCSTKEGVYSEVERARKKLEAKVRAARAERVKETLEDVVAANRAALAAKPHPKAKPDGTGYFADKTMLDYVEWMLKNAGATGRAKLLKEVKAALGL